MDEREFGPEVYTFTDEEGNDVEFEMLASAEIGGEVYYAMHPIDNADEAEGEYQYVILKSELDETGEEWLVTVDDEEEFDSVADYFDDLLTSETDYDLASDADSDAE